MGCTSHLQQAVGAKGSVTPEVPFSVLDLQAWKELAGTYWEDQEKVSKVVETIIRTQHHYWNYLQGIVAALIIYERKGLVIAKAREEAERIHAQGMHQGSLEDHLPSVALKWDPNNQVQQDLLIKYQHLIFFGMKHAIQKPKNLSKLYQIVQGKDEPPADFFNRLMETDQKYTDLDLEKKEDAAQLAHIFIGQSNANIKWKWQKQQAKSPEPRANCLQVAWSVYTSKQEVERRREK